MSGFQQFKTGLSQLPRTKAINSPVPEGFSIPESRVRELETPEFSWAQDTLLQYRSLIEFAQKDNHDWRSMAELPDFYDTLSKKLQESSISAVSLPEKIKDLDQLIYVDRKMKELDSNIEQEVRKILNLLDQADEQINSIRINSGSPASPLSELLFFLLR
ncbi:hypothetical protein CROQUDRAFT_214395 [Cronartium quercuum f. sp. fusiforme G11]|uniref:Uncharacterized protein n=1 Tax=Cronartium quercuum f. sp. fusiforme G11 TaxID=708437 RepID=A0A9P6NUB0_9BASI|nr:hypothetical protein CROQUDRAFT_214395 [Cronartium quercuum f. sp. fusiforme G11]